MRKVLLVDDDEKSLKGIRAILLRADTSFKDICECCDGSQAEIMLQKEKFDLVITDIRMPKMDGINFIRRAQMLSHKPKFLIMSGYQNFSFAREALKYGVKEYLLKPVGRLELIESVKKIEKELEQEEFFSSEKIKNDLLLSILRIKEINFIFLNEMLSETEIKEILDRVKLKIFSAEYYIYVADAIHKNADQNTCEEKQCFNDDFIENTFKSLGDDVLIFYDVQGRIIFISRQLLNAQYIVDELEAHYSQKYIIGFGNKSTSPGMIRTAYLQALEALKYKIFFDGDRYGKAITYAEIKNLSTDYSIPVNIIKKIPEMLGTNMYNEVGGLLDSLFSRETIYQYPIDYTEKIVDYLYSYIFQYFIEHMPFEFSFLEQSNRKLKKIENYACIQDYLNAMKMYLDAINHFFNQSLDCTKTDNLDIAIKFIKENYYKDINLTYVSNYVSLNYNYFSNAFHQKTGMRFIEYLNLLRINRAKELLYQNESNINEIANKVGLTNPKHFTKIFKSIVGISPCEYRSKLRKG